MSSSSAAFSLDHLSPHPSEKLCYVRCDFCETVLAVSVPCSSLFKIVTVRCGHCTNLLSVNMRAHLFPAANQLHLGHHPFLAPHHNLLDELPCPPPPLLLDQPTLNNNSMPPEKRTEEELPPTPIVNRREGFSTISHLLF